MFALPEVAPDIGGLGGRQKLHAMDADRVCVFASADRFRFHWASALFLDDGESAVIPHASSTAETRNAA